MDEDVHTSKLHEAFVDKRNAEFIGRKTLIKEILKQMSDLKTGVLCLAGKPGCGKSSLVVRIEHTANNSVHFTLKCDLFTSFYLKA